MRSHYARPYAHLRVLGCFVICFVSLTCVFWLGAPTPANAQTQTQTQPPLTISGNVRIATGTIETIAREALGDNPLPPQINRAVQDLFATEFFTDVIITPNGQGFTVTVTERPSINLVRIEGNARLTNDILLEVVTSKPRQTFSAARAEEDANAIARSYAAAGRITTSVVPKTIRRSSNRVDLVFEVDEGNVSEVKKISFIGNRQFADARLRGVIESKQTGLFSFISKRDNFSQDKLEFDKEKLTQFYNQHGYIDFQVVSSTNALSRDSGGFGVVFKVSEGPQYRFANLRYVDETGQLDLSLYQDLLNIRMGTVFNPLLVNNIIERILIRAGENNESFLNPVPNIVRHDEDLTVDVEITMNITDPVFIERINIEGNAVTLDRVIRRQFEVVEGDAFNQYFIQQAADRIRALGFFERVDITTREGSRPNQIIIDVDLTEKTTTGSLGFGIGYSTSDGVSGNVSIQQNNLLGRGQRIGATFNISRQRNTLNFNFFEPAVLDRDLSFGVNVGRTLGSSSYIPVDTDILSLNPEFGFPVGQWARLRVGYTISRLRITAERGTRRRSGASLDSISPVLRRDVDKGDIVTSSILVGYTVDRRNSPIQPTYGSTFSIDQETGGLGGNSRFSKTTLNYKIFRSLLNDDYVFSVEMQTGALIDFDRGSHIYRRFNLGGDSFRGFRPYGIGPRDTRTGDATGGNFFAIVQFESSFPIGVPEEYGIFGGAFLDIGTVWGLNDIGGADFSGEHATPKVRAAIGLSLFWETGIGPLRFNLARPLLREDYDRKETFRFTLDARF